MFSSYFNIYTHKPPNVIIETKQRAQPAVKSAQPPAHSEHASKQINEESGSSESIDKLILLAFCFIMFISLCVAGGTSRARSDILHCNS